MRRLARLLALLVMPLALVACETTQNHDMPPPDIATSGRTAPP